MEFKKSMLAIGVLMVVGAWFVESVREIRRAEASGSYTASPFRRSSTSSSPSPSPSVDASGNPIPAPSQTPGA